MMRFVALLRLGAGGGGGSGLGPVLLRSGNLDLGLAEMFLLTQSLSPTLKISSFGSHLSGILNMLIRVIPLYTNPSFTIDKEWFSGWTLPE